MASSSMVLYRPGPSSSLTTTSHSTSLLPARLFTAQTGTAIATELLYRLLMDILNRLIHSLHKFASSRLDQLSAHLEKRAALRQQQHLDAAAAREQGLGIVEEVEKLVERRGFELECPMGGGAGGGMGGIGGPPGPPRWVKGVLEGVREGRMEERDFWIHTHGD
ncbi:hypothetical protein BU24DRAFT_458003 [Aaosphaeria arxii CBS 175.79]|uniref:Uncharacterized protein n=1 Tax=Aaosphaeria arxii CBS 175.79 TaxID=1450172 RepID=A0A6A5Y956_9PLEO|nr:uncharacterized protein BU24DRAFT_458003 [Aaosphaeria arxii CBS 175.79]KAF2022115.1 hypothetical protein BU24DRAFT_458003 [Aaosphaeria arxii CBS 175.79]